MPNRNAIFIAGVAAMAACPWTLAAAVDEDGASPPPAQMATPPPRANPLGVVPLGAVALANKRGGTEIVAEARLRGVVAGNSASDLMTGTNTLSDGAFSGAAGLPIVIQNTGNNVLIQNSTIVTIQLK